MKRNTLYLSLLGFFLLSGAAWAQDFEGQYVQRMSIVDGNDIYEVLGEAIYSDDVDVIIAALIDLPVDELVSQNVVGVDQELRIFVKKDFMRVESATGGPSQGYQIMNSRTGTSWMVNVPDKSYMEFTKQTAEEMEQKSRELIEEMGMDPDQMEDYMEEDAGEAGTVKSTGRTSEINGRRSTAWRYADDQEVAVGWCAPDDSGFMAAMKRMTEESAYAEEDAKAEGLAGFECPDGQLHVRTLTFDRYSQQLEIDDLLEIRKSALSDDLFEVPAGFEKKSLQWGNVPGQ